MIRRVESSPAVPSVASMMWRFAITGLLVLTGIVLASGQISQNLGQAQAFSQARQVARLTGFGIIQPQLTPGLFDTDPADLEALNEVVRQSVLSGSLVRVKLWAEDGEILYSDEGRLIGESYTPSDDRAEALTTGEVVAEITDLAEPENRFEQGGDELLEVYVPLTTEDDTQVLYEAYFRLDGVRAAGRQAWLAFAPITIGTLLVLQLVQIPIAWSMARRIRRETVQQQSLLQRALTSSEVERRRIAADLHDGVVQDLTGVSYTLTALAADDPDGAVADGARQIRSTIQQLRSLLVDIYPPDLANEGLGAALEDLLSRHRARGIAATLQVAPSLDLPVTHAALVYRIAHEALRNVAAHADATSVEVVVTQDAEGVVMTIDDDGVGFDVDSIMGEGPAAATDAEHFGLRILRDSAAELGGRLSLRSGPDAGTRLQLEFPT